MAVPDAVEVEDLPVRMAAGLVEVVDEVVGVVVDVGVVRGRCWLVEKVVMALVQALYWID